MRDAKYIQRFRIVPQPLQSDHILETSAVREWSSENPKSKPRKSAQAPFPPETVSAPVLRAHSPLSGSLRSTTQALHSTISGSPLGRPQATHPVHAYTSERRPFHPGSSTQPLSPYPSSSRPHPPTMPQYQYSQSSPPYLSYPSHLIQPLVLPHNEHQNSPDLHLTSHTSPFSHNRPEQAPHLRPYPLPSAYHSPSTPNHPPPNTYTTNPYVSYVYNERSHPYQNAVSQDRSHFTNTAPHQSPQPTDRH